MISSILESLRLRGLKVVSHNDYCAGGIWYTFWMMTYQIGGQKYAFKGEGKSDDEALKLIELEFMSFTKSSSSLNELLSKIILIETCSVCPEQYDAYIGTEKIGYLRLRWGHFTVEFVPMNKLVYQSDTYGDGAFSEEEREGELKNAKIALLTEYENWKKIVNQN